METASSPINESKHMNAAAAVSSILPCITEGQSKATTPLSPSLQNPIPYRSHLQKMQQQQQHSSPSLSSFSSYPPPPPNPSPSPKEAKSLFCLLATTLVSILFILSFSRSTTSSTLSSRPSSSSSSTSSSSNLLLLRPSSPTSPPLPPSLAYFLSGSTGGFDPLLRLLFAVYHPNNHYLLHLDLSAPHDQRRLLALSVQAVPAFRAARNVHVLGKADFANPAGPSALAATLHGAAVLLRLPANWDWFVNLNVDDYPLVTQDGMG